MAVIRVEGVWKQFQLQSARPRTLKEFAVAALRDPKSLQAGKFWALQDVTFEIEKGETFGIIGDNGSGKSTLLKLFTGISRPTSGRVTVDGRVSALLELGAGFHGDFTGRENVFLNGAILGLSKRELSEQFDRIVAFSELGDFIDQPVKTYSSGMYMRLAFSVAIHVNPDILVIDEVLAVGDMAFQQKCYDQIERFKHEGKTIVLVSHSLGVVQNLCQRAAWLDRGVLRTLGKTENVLGCYTEHAARQIERNKSEQPVLIPSGRGSVSGLRLFGTDGDERAVFRPGEEVGFAFEADALLPPKDLAFVAKIFRSDGVCCYEQRVRGHELVGHMPCRVSVRIPRLALNPGHYTLQAILATAADEGLDEKFFNFAVEGETRSLAVAPLDADWIASADGRMALVRAESA